MKKITLFCLAICASFIVKAQDLPYSKYLNFTQVEFKENHFKYNEKYNTWTLKKTDGLSVTLNVLSIILDAEEDLRPGKKDYCIVVQMGKENKASSVEVVFYNDETYHKLLTFIKDNGQNIVETSSGNLIKQQAFYDDYALELNMDRHIKSRTSARTLDYKTVKNVDESYNKYRFVIRTGVEPWSKKLEKQAEKAAKRDAKGKKKQNVDDLM
jgi:hypothetical protein